jgi:hypothetical protein
MVSTVAKLFVMAGVGVGAIGMSSGVSAEEIPDAVSQCLDSELPRTVARMAGVTTDKVTFNREMAGALEVIATSPDGAMVVSGAVAPKDRKVAGVIRLGANTDKPGSASILIEKNPGHLNIQFEGDGNNAGLALNHAVPFINQLSSDLDGCEKQAARKAPSAAAPSAPVGGTPKAGAPNAAKP